MTEPGERDRFLQRLSQIQRERKVRTLGGLLSSVAIGQLLFASFAFGHSRGPMPLSAFELVMGMMLALIFGSVLAIITARRRLENRSDLVVRLTEGRHSRRIAVFDDFFTIDQEVVLDDTVDDLTVDEEKLVIRYIDPKFDGPVLRELEGAKTVLEKLVTAVRAA